jgi:hypothetical protein
LQVFYSKVKFCTVFHNVLLLWSEPPSLYRNPFFVCSGEPVFCLLYTFRAWINKLLRSPSPPPFMFPCLNVVNFLLPPIRPLVICGHETVHFEKETIVQCCGSGMFIPDPNFSLPDPGSKRFRIPDPNPHQRVSIFNPKNCF